MVDAKKKLEALKCLENREEIPENEEEKS